MIMVHGDDKGLVLPPRIAPCQVICIPIPNSKLTDEQRQGLTGKIEEMTKVLEDADVLTKSDDRENYTPGWKYNHWELKGVPIRLEIGMRDVEAGTCVFAKRHDGSKCTVPMADVVAQARAAFD